MTTAILTGDETSHAKMIFRGETIPVIIGAAGIRQHKEEGDNATPLGVLPLRRVFYRADRVARPQTSLPVEPLCAQDGWCDDRHHQDYNKHISLPHPGRHEVLWRDDHVYDIIVVLGYNDAPAVPGKGSAIFMHLQQPTGAPTEGCIALTEPMLRRLLESDLSDIEVRLRA